MAAAIAGDVRYTSSGSELGRNQAEDPGLASSIPFQIKKHSYFCYKLRGIYPSLTHSLSNWTHTPTRLRFAFTKTSSAVGVTLSHNIIVHCLGLLEDNVCPHGLFLGWPFRAHGAWPHHP